MRRRPAPWLVLALLALAPAAPAEPATSLIGRIVLTRDGEELGRVRDLAIDLDTGRVRFVVVSVGSFLIQDSLIAVAPDALRDSADGDGRLVLEAGAEALHRAHRFAEGDWPQQADVRRDAATSAVGSAAVGGDAEPATPPRGTAIISDGRRRATLSAGERRIKPVASPPPAGLTQGAAAKPAVKTEEPRHPAPATQFERLDRDRNGALDRAEIAHELDRSHRFADIDIDGNGVIDRGEWQRFEAER